MSLGLILAPSLPAEDPPPRKVVLIAGRKSHGPGHHEYEKGVELLKRCLDASPGLGIRTEVHLEGWPRDPRTLDDADTILLFCDGSDRSEAAHPLLRGDRLEVMERQMRRGCGLVAIHYTVFVPNGKPAERFLEWIGGYFDYQSGPGERGWYSAIGTHRARTAPGAPEHPIARGWKSYLLEEEFYYRIRFREEDPRPVPILLADIPGRPEPEVVAWAVERPDGGRGFGFTGGHFHSNWRGVQEGSLRSTPAGGPGRARPAVRGRRTGPSGSAPRACPERGQLPAAGGDAPRGAPGRRGRHRVPPRGRGRAGTARGSARRGVPVDRARGHPATPARPAARLQVGERPLRDPLRRCPSGPPFARQGGELHRRLPVGARRDSGDADLGRGAALRAPPRAARGPERPRASPRPSCPPTGLRRRGVETLPGGAGSSAPRGSAAPAATPSRKARRGAARRASWERPPASRSPSSSSRSSFPRSRWRRPIDRPCS